MRDKRFVIDKDYDREGNWEYCYIDNETGRVFNFADECCNYDFLKLVNAVINNLLEENEQLKQQIEYQEEVIVESVDKLMDLPSASVFLIKQWIEVLNGYDSIDMMRDDFNKQLKDLEYD